ncbi:AAA domain-containing protein [Faunimonas pinastri]|uniref:AAA domain-containing protein n=1 Tax=Faunimonas pinastri TaxID=1855383 RepID=A0A1H9NRH7_9HYPH|nr:DUF3320 domain-containing protein [Faunimonas pinastri]SER38501.1 AAA domain-containing protein [Faunimonas pinastri]
MSEAPAAASLRDRLMRDRLALLDLSTRNRLLNVPLRTKNNRAIEIVGEKTAEVHRLLGEGRRFAFLAGNEPETEADEAEGLAEEGAEYLALPQPENGDKGEDEVDERGVLKRHSDLKLQTRLSSEGLQKRLLDIWYNSRTLEEEQGVNVLYLALGLLRWTESDSSETVRQAPLVLLPVQLERTTAAEKFKLKTRGEPASPNLTLQAKLRNEFGILLEDFADEDELDVAAYIAGVTQAVASKPKWDVLPDAMVLGFFSFAKFLMYRDLDPENWPDGLAIDDHLMVRALLRDGFPASEPLIPGDEARIDAVIPPVAMQHVLDADSSQAVVIEEAARGRTLVVKGPPGTGKSQTIANIIAAAAARGKTVLFVAEKMAALDVVHRRLRSVGLGALALELHSHKATKRTLLDELKRTRDIDPGRLDGDDTTLERLTAARDTLNAHAELLHTPLEPSRLTPYQIFGELIRLQDGPGLPGYPLQPAASWTPAQRQARRDALDELVARIRTVGSPAQHVWRGVRSGPLDPAEVSEIQDRIGKLRRHLEEARVAAAIMPALGIPEPGTLDTLVHSLRVLDAAVTFPESERAILAHPAWQGERGKLAALVAAGRQVSGIKAALEAVFVPAAWDMDLLPIRTAIALKGDSLFRFVDGGYRAQMRLFRSCLREEPPKSASEQLALLDRMMEAQKARRISETEQSLGAAFGPLWQGENSDWDRLRAVLSWREANGNLPDEFWSAFPRLADIAPVAAAQSLLTVVLPDLLSGFRAIVDRLDLDLGRAFGAANLGDVAPQDLSERIDGWLAAPEQLSRWISFLEGGRKADALGLGGFVEGVLDGGLDDKTLLPTFDAAFHDAMRRHLFARYPALRGFDGDSQNRLITQFAELDRRRIALARQEIAHRHGFDLPRGAGSAGSALAVLAGEFAKKQRHLPIRQLLEKAGPVIQRLKPVFMMSPLSVAQFLKPGAVSFDLLVIDEASQIEPVDALGAVARANQIVVVGDEKQLPPTRFFAKLTSEADEPDEDDEDTFRARDAESILDLCLAKGAPTRMLNWHYRSKHQSLIAVSNREFYENRLFIVPSPYDGVPGIGLKFRYLPDTAYERGGSRTNPREADAVAAAVIRHAREHPEESLGVATFSTAQREAILNRLELLRRENPELESFFGPKIEPFFVKNLENIQGDERDVIFISVGYGKDAQGYASMSFGPLNGEGGERRLNVLISRAKLRCEVFTNMQGDDIDLERTKSRGVAALKTFLAFAESGQFAGTEESGRGPDSPFEEEVASRLRARGHDVRLQIGSAGFFVDLAIADAEKPGRFLLGIECDGAQYHSSRSARDRDRLRQQVLEAHGWVIHRIWSTDWYLRPEEELRKVEAAIEQAVTTWRTRDGESARQAADGFDGEEFAAIPTESAAVEREPEPPPTPYEEAAPAVDREREPPELSVAEMADVVAGIVEIEGPVHSDEIIVRVRTAWGLARAGSRIREAVLAGLAQACDDGRIEGGPFYAVPGKDVVVRDRSATRSPSLRKPDMLPPAEVDAALMAEIDRNFGAPRKDLAIAAGRRMGFRATSAPLRTAMEQRLESLLAEKMLAERGGRIVRARPKPAVGVSPAPRSGAAAANEATGPRTGSA